MAKRKKKRKLQPHEKGFAKAIIWAVCLAAVITILALPRETTFGQDQLIVRNGDIHRVGRHGSRYLLVFSTEGAIYNVSDPEIPILELKELLPPGTEVDVEYFETWITRLFFFRGAPVTKLTLDGQVLVNRTISTDNSDIWTLLWICPVILFFGFLRWASGEHLLHKWKKKREKERKRLKREGKIK